MGNYKGVYKMMTIPKDNYDWMNAYNKAVEVIKKHDFEADNAVNYVETLAALEAIITGLDEMAKTRPTGKWETFVEDYNKCSKCGEMGKFYRFYKYCPNCGAKMQEMEE